MMTDSKNFVDRRAHQRLDELKEDMEKLHLEHQKLRQELGQNTALTQQVAANTIELVDLVKGAKGMRKLLIWITPLVAAGYTLIEYIKTRH